MKDKNEILAEIKSYLDDGLIKPEDLADLVPTQKYEQGELIASTATVETGRSNGGITAMFVVGGILLYGAIQAALAFSADFSSRGGWLIVAVINMLVGVAAWYLACKSRGDSSDVSKGLALSALIVGSFGVVAGWGALYVAIVSDMSNLDFLPGMFIASIFQLLCASSFIIFERIIDKHSLLQVGSILIVSSIATLVTACMMEADIDSGDPYVIAYLAFAGLLAALPRLAKSLYAGKEKVVERLDSLAVFFALVTLYVATFLTDTGLIWTVLLFAAVFGVYYLSVAIKRRSNLISASVFFILAVNTVAFKHFAGYAIAVALVLSAISIIGAAIVAVNLNNKYFKASGQ